MAILKPNYPVELRIVGKKHFYLAGTDVDAVLLPGVTGFLQIISKPALVPWAKKEALASVRAAFMDRIKDTSRPLEFSEQWIDEIIGIAKKRPDKIKDDAADLGTLVHKYIDQIIQGKIPTDLTPGMEPAVTAFIDWWQKSKIEIVLGDTKVASLKHGYGGSLDALGRQDGKYVVLDWKTSGGIYDEYSLQAAAYIRAFEETFGQECSRGFVVRFSKKLPIEFEVKEIADVEKSFQAFLTAKKLTELMLQEHFL